MHAVYSAMGAMVLLSSCAHKRTAPPAAQATTVVAVGRQVDSEGVIDSEKVIDCPVPGDEALWGRPGSEGLGLHPQNPLQWGRAANGELWFGRLICAGGSVPRISRVGAVEYDETDGYNWKVVDEWSVICPEFAAEQRWFSTAESCDMTDPPSGLGVMSVEVALALGEVAALLKSEDHSGALARSRSVADDYPDLQAPQLALLVSAIALKDAPTAKRALRDALDFNPDDLRLVVMEALFHARGGDLEGAARVLERPQAINEADALVLACAKSRLAFLAGDKPTAVALRKEACDSDENCCPDALARLVGR